MTVAPGCLGQLAHRDQRGDGGRARPVARARRPRSSGRRRRRRRGRCRRRRSRTAACRSTRFSGSSGFASWLGKVPSSSKYSGDQVERQPVEHGRHGVPGHAVARVDDDLQRPDAAKVDQVAQVARRSAGAGRARRPCPGGRRRRSGTPASASVADLGQPGVLADRRGAGPAQLDAVVAGRVVAGGEHRAGQVEAAAGEVELVGRGQPDVDDVGALAGRARGERGDELGRGRPHVVADDDRAARRRR